jgi:CheY-like chemotaxis protein
MKLKEATVLLVDDELELLEIFGMWLERYGCRVLTAANGEEALGILMREQVHALISDIRMPIMDGVTLLRKVHEHDLQIPAILFVSGFGDVERREMHALGVEKLLEKPLRKQHLVQALEESLKDREELWLTRRQGPTDQTLELELDSMETLTGCGFRLGRGGCCVPHTGKLEEDRMLELTVEFKREHLALRAQCEVEWFSPECGCAGVAFRYLDAESRGWVIASMKRHKPRAFIPQCDTGLRISGAAFQPSSLPEHRPAT